MKTKIKYALTFLFGIAYLWGMQTIASPNFGDISFLAGLVSAIVCILGSFLILIWIVDFFTTAWNAEEK